MTINYTQRLAPHVVIACAFNKSTYERLKPGKDKYVLFEIHNQLSYKDNVFTDVCIFRHLLSVCSVMY